MTETQLTVGHDPYTLTDKIRLVIADAPLYEQGQLTAHLRYLDQEWFIEPVKGNDIHICGIDLTAFDRNRICGKYDLFATDVEYRIWKKAQR